jgi:hypothetical protein
MTMTMTSVFHLTQPGFNQTFPGVRVHLLGHNAIFRIPLFRVLRREISVGEKDRGTMS